MTAPWKPASAPASNFSLANYVGRLLLITPGGTHEDWPIGQNTAPTVRANVVIVETGEEWLDVLMFAVKVVAQLRGEAGNVVLGRVLAEKGRGSNDMLSISPELTDTDQQWAQYWLAQHPGRLQELQHLASITFQAEEGRRGRPAQASQPAPAAPPPPPPAMPTAPPVPPPVTAPPPLSTEPAPWAAPAPPVAPPAAAPPPVSATMASLQASAAAAPPVETPPY